MLKELQSHSISLNTQRAGGRAITIDFSDIFVLTPSSSSSDVAPGKY